MMLVTQERTHDSILVNPEYREVVKTLACLLHPSLYDELEERTFISDLVRVIAKHVPNGSIGAPDA